ncbi:MAG TPA: septal ring lytic transglycosylase RlpA family protein [Stellaceae bacterium]
MDMLRGSLKWTVWATAALALAACGTEPHHAGNAPFPAASSGTGHSHGFYKVGKPYQIQGTWYYPSENWSYDETGIASWYGEQFHGRYTADGEVFNLNELSAAHRTLPMPAVVRVTNLENGRSIKLRVNDRGPYARGRIIDVSRRAAQMLGFEGQGTAKVRVQIDVPDSMKVAAAAGRNGGGHAPSAGAMIAAVVSAPIALPVAAVVAATTPAPKPAPREVRVADNRPMAESVVVPADRPYILDDLPGMNAPPTSTLERAPTTTKISIVPVKSTQIYVQAGAFSDSENAHRMEQRLRGLGQPVRVMSAAVNGASIYRVRVGPVASVDAADTLLDRVVSNGIPDARIVVD